MRFLVAFLALIPLQAMSLKDFNIKPTHDQSVYVVDFIEKMTADLGAKNPQLAQDIRDWFSRKQDGKPYSAGLERLYVELGALESLAHDGKVDLTKIQVEGVIVKVVKDKFLRLLRSSLDERRGMSPYREMLTALLYEASRQSQPFQA